jgi:cardiolipin synthase
VGSQHGEIIRRVRDEVKRRVLITSHRLGTYAGPGVLAPLAVAVKARSIDAQLFFTTKTGVLDIDARDDLLRDFGQSGIAVTAVAEPRLHAKMLAWDNDFVLITSQNWLSADSGDDPSEVGIFVQAPKVADRLISDFEAARSSDV